MKVLLLYLTLCSLAVAGKDTPIKPVRLREVSLQKVPLKEDERIASIEVEVSGARFRGVRIPNDWGFDVGAPVSGVSRLTGAAAHGVGMPFTTDEFERFLTLAFYDYDQDPFSIKVKLGLYLYDPKKGESQRVIELSPESVVLKEASKKLPLGPVVERE